MKTIRTVQVNVLFIFIKETFISKETVHTNNVQMVSLIVYTLACEQGNGRLPGFRSWSPVKHGVVGGAEKRFVTSLCAARDCISFAAPLNILHSRKWNHFRTGNAGVHIERLSSSPLILLIYTSKARPLACYSHTSERITERKSYLLRLFFCFTIISYC